MDNLLKSVLLQFNQFIEKTYDIVTDMCTIFFYFLHLILTLHGEH